jgi:hypothetical protein
MEKLKLKCSTCKKVKDYIEFDKDKSRKSGHHNSCKICRKSEYSKDKSRNNRLKNNYSLTEIQLQQLFISQEQKCKICKKHFEKVSTHKGLYIDHDHKTKKVRGLLCGRCNRLLGNACDNTDILLSAILYLNYYEKKKD